MAATGLDIDVCKGAGFRRVASYPCGGFGCDATLSIAFKKPKNSPFWFYKTAQISV